MITWLVGSAVRDKALRILLHALAPDEALSPEEAANKLEAALYASCTNGKASGQPAEPGVTYMRRLKVLWSWLDGSSPYRSHGLKRLFIEGTAALCMRARALARHPHSLQKVMCSWLDGSCSDRSDALKRLSSKVLYSAFKHDRQFMHASGLSCRPSPVLSAMQARWRQAAAYRRASGYMVYIKSDVLDCCGMPILRVATEGDSTNVSSLVLHAGKLAAPELATMDARRARDLTDPPTASTASQPGSQQDIDGTPAGVFHTSSSYAQVRTERAVFDSNPIIFF